MNERRAELIYGQVLQRMDMTRETGDEELQELIRMTCLLYTSPSPRDS